MANATAPNRRVSKVQLRLGPPSHATTTVALPDAEPGVTICSSVSDAAKRGSEGVWPRPIEARRAERSPLVRRTGGGRMGNSAASKRHYTAFRHGSVVRERPLVGRGRGCENILGPVPHQALGEGRSPPRPKWLLRHGRPRSEAVRRCRASG